MGLVESIGQALSGTSPLILPLAFMGGLATTISPCTIAMMPILVGYIGGYSYDSKWDVFFQTILFITGLAFTFSVMGVIAALLGKTLGSFVPIQWFYLMGILAIVLGIHQLDLIHINFPGLKQLPQLPKEHVLAPFVLGAAFGAASSPCGTPYLAAILGIIAVKKSFMLGGAALFSYALGQGVLLLAVGLFTGLLKHMAILRHVGTFITKLSGAVFVLAGVLMLIVALGWLR